MPNMHLMNIWLTYQKTVGRVVMNDHKRAQI